MIEAEYRHHEIDARYINYEVARDALGDAVRGARATGWAWLISIHHWTGVDASLAVMRRALDAIFGT